MAEKLEKICSLLDKLSLEVLILMEQHIQAKIGIEKTLSEGESHLVKSRYIMGAKSVSSLQLPTQDGPEYSALARVHSEEDAKLFGQKSFDLEFHQMSKGERTDSEDTYRDPLKWFGILVPQDLRQAQGKYRRALIQCVRSANLQTQLHETCIKIKQLREYKKKLMESGQVEE